VDIIKGGTIPNGCIPFQAAPNTVGKEGKNLYAWRLFGEIFIL
jgi:hypothetical protein